MTSSSLIQPADVLRFWFEELEPKDWWTGGASIDAQITERFGALVTQALAGELYAWRETPQGRLAEILCLDQFPRNIFRGTGQAFAGDGLALVLAQEAVLGGHDAALEGAQRHFLLMPFMHSESLVIHRWADTLFRAAGFGDDMQFLIDHTEVIERFGRYPSRNAALGRESTPEERAYLETGHTWGQG